MSGASRIEFMTLDLFEPESLASISKEWCNSWMKDTRATQQSTEQGTEHCLDEGRRRRGRVDVMVRPKGSAAMLLLLFRLL